MDLADRVTALTGAGRVREVAGGHQGRVFEARGGDLARPLAVKVLDPALVDQAEVAARSEIVARLAAVDPRISAPYPLGGQLVTRVDRDDGPVLITATEWAEGRLLDPGAADDSVLMGRTLAAVHASMRDVDASALGPVAALRAVPVDPALGDQLLHGDVNHGNLRVEGDVVRLFDLDDCGRGPALFDVANAVYMARFSASVGSDAGATFEAPFVTAYADASGAPIDRDVLEHLVDVRVRALLVWLDDLEQAPIGIRTAEPTWHATLRRFAEDHLAR